jgi:hypothetical protein
MGSLIPQPGHGPDTNVLQTCVNGVYGEERVRG